MNLNEINFSFGGLHCLRDFGAIYVEKSGHAIAPAITRNEYAIAGMAGSLAMPGAVPETVAFSGSLYFLHDPPPSQAAAQERLRRMSAWLTNGRRVGKRKERQKAATMRVPRKGGRRRRTGEVPRARGRSTSVASGRDLIRHGCAVPTFGVNLPLSSAAGGEGDSRSPKGKAFFS